MTNLGYAPLKGLDALERDDLTALESAAGVSDSSSPSEYSVCCDVGVTDLHEEEGDERDDTSRKLALEDFHSHEDPSMLLSKLLICMVLRLFYPFSWWAVWAMLKMEFIKPSIGYTTRSQVNMIFFLQGAWLNLLVAPLLACNIAAYCTSPCYRSSGPLFAVIFPWLASFLLIPHAVAGAGSFFSNKLRITCSLFVLFMQLLARQCRDFNAVDREMQHLNGTLVDCFTAMKTVTNQETLTMDSQLCCLRLDGRKRLRNTVYRIVDMHTHQLLPIPNRLHVIFRAGSIKLADSAWMDRWPATDRFLTQQRRINNLSHITLFVPALDAERIPDELLESYKRGLKGREMSAVDFASQMSLGFEPPLLMRASHVAVGCLHCLVVGGACFLSWWLPQWQHGPWYCEVMFVVFCVFGIGMGVSLPTGHLWRCSWEFTKRLMELRALNATLSGPVAAADRFVPMMRVKFASDLLVWAEVRELCCASYAARQLEVELSVLVATVLTFAMAVACLYSALEPTWEPGLFSLVALLTMILYIINAVPFFITAVLVNLENKNTLNLMCQYALQTLIALSHPDVATDDEREQMHQTLAMAKLLNEQLRQDSPANVHILGAKLTLSTASALASAVSAALAFTLNNLPMEAIEAKLYKSGAWQKWFA